MFPGMAPGGPVWAARTASPGMSDVGENCFEPHLDVGGDRGELGPADEGENHQGIERPEFSLCFIVSFTSIVVSTPKPWFFSSSVTRRTAVS